MAPRNRERLRQFDNPENVARLLAFPEAERTRGLVQRNPLRAAKCFERALAVALLTHCSLRIQNLRTIDLTTDLNRAGRKWYLSISRRAGEEWPSARVSSCPSMSQPCCRNIGATIGHSWTAPTALPLSWARRRTAAPQHDAHRMSANPPQARRYRHDPAPVPARHRQDRGRARPGPRMSPCRGQLGHRRIDMTMTHYLGTETRAPADNQPAAARGPGRIAAIRRTRPMPRYRSRRRSCPMGNGPAPTGPPGQAAIEEGDILDGQGPAAHWAAATSRAHVRTTAAGSPICSMTGGSRRTAAGRTGYARRRQGLRRRAGGR